MPGNNDFLQFANGGGANVVTQAAYAALAATVLANGYSAGTALSNQLNKTWRQSATMSKVLGDLIANITGQNVVDDGTSATILSNLMAALTVAGYAVDTGAVNAYVITMAPAPIALYDGMEIRFKTANANTSTTPTVNPNGLGNILLTNAGGAGVIIGQIQAATVQSAFYNAVANRFELQSSGAVPAGTLLAYAGGTVPSGYLLCPSVATNVSTTTYAALFAALGYSWGGAGANFGLPYFAAGYAAVQGSIAVLTHGKVKDHTHQYQSSVQTSSGGSAGAGTAANTATATTATPNAPEGGADNLAAGMGTQFIVKY